VAEALAMQMDELTGRIWLALKKIKQPSGLTGRTPMLLKVCLRSPSQLLATAANSCPPLATVGASCERYRYRRPPYSLA
jgi:hypothetical protein